MYEQQQKASRMAPVVVFFSDTKENKFKSHLEGRPIFDDVEKVRITFPADRQRTFTGLAHSSAMVTDASGKRTRKIGGKEITYAELYKEEYRRFKANEGPTVRGTPLTEAPFLTQGQRASLKALDVYTIEQLSNANPKNLGMGGMDMVNKAKAYLEAASGTADVTRLSADNAALKQEIERLRAEREAVKEEAVSEEGPSIEDLKDRIAALNNGKRPIGNYGREKLVAMLAELESGEAA